MYLEGTPVYKQGRRNRERQHFWGHPQICPFLTFNTLHKLMFTETGSPVIEIAPLVLRPLGWKRALVIEIECPFSLVQPPPPPAEKVHAPAIELACPLVLCPLLAEKCPQWSKLSTLLWSCAPNRWKSAQWLKLGPHFSLVRWRRFRVASGGGGDGSSHLHLATLLVSESWQQ